MLGREAAVMEMVSPSQLSPAVIHTMWTASTRVLGVVGSVAIAVLL
jgi:hypothetical protein